METENDITQPAFGYIESPYDVRDYRLAYGAVKTDDLPESFELELPYIKNQGDKPTCAAHACSELVEYYNFTQQKQKIKFSTDFIYGIREDDYYYGDGMYLRDAMKTIQKYGDVQHVELSSNSDVDDAHEKVLAHEAELKESAHPNRISTYYKITNDDEMKYALYHHGPVVIGMRWFIGGSAPASNGYVFRYDQHLLNSGHAVVVVGWTSDGKWIVQNSWGLTWGKKGHFYIEMANGFTGDQVIREAYGSTDDIIDGKIIKKPSKFVKFLSKILNFIINVFRIAKTNTSEE